MRTLKPRGRNPQEELSRNRKPVSSTRKQGLQYRKEQPHLDPGFSLENARTSIPHSLVASRRNPNRNSFRHPKLSQESAWQLHLGLERNSTDHSFSGTSLLFASFQLPAWVPFQHSLHSFCMRFFRSSPILFWA